MGSDDQPRSQSRTPSGCRRTSTCHGERTSLNGSRHAPTPLSSMPWVSPEVLRDRLKLIDLLGQNQVLSHPLLHERIRCRNPRHIGELEEHLRQLIPSCINSSLVLTKIRGQSDAALHRHPQIRRHRIGNQVPLDDSDHFGGDPLGLELPHGPHPLRYDAAPLEVFLLRIGDKVRVKDRERAPGTQMHPIWCHLRAPQTERGCHVQSDLFPRSPVLSPNGGEITIVPCPVVHYRVIIVHVGRLPSPHVDLVPNGQSLPSRQEHGPNQGPMHPKVHHYHHVPTGVVPQPVSDIPQRRYLGIRRHGSHKWDQALILPTISNGLVHIGSRDQYLDHGFSVSSHPLELNRLPKVRELHDDVSHHGEFIPMHLIHQRSARCIFLSIPVPNGTVAQVASDPRCLTATNLVLSLRRTPSPSYMTMSIASTCPIGKA